MADHRAETSRCPRCGVSTDREYQMTRGDGVWYLPSNHGETMFRLIGYDEDGTAVRGAWPNEKPIYGRFWRVEYVPMSALDTETEGWTEIEHMISTRREAIEAALSSRHGHDCRAGRDRQGADRG